MVSFEKKIAFMGEEIYSCTLGHGTSILVWHKPWMKTEHVNLSMYCGGVYPSPGYLNFPAGTAHFLEHMVLNDSDGREFFKDMMTKGVRCNGYTHFINTTYTLMMYDFKPRVILDFVHHVHSVELTEVEKQKRIISSEISAATNRRLNKVISAVFSYLFPTLDDYFSVIGSIESIGRISSDVLTLYRERFYTSDNLSLMFTGPTPLEKILDTCELLDETIPASPYSTIDMLKQINRPSVIVLNFSHLNMTTIAFTTGSEATHVIKDDIILRIFLESIVGIGSRLHKQVQSARGSVTYQVDAIPNYSFGLISFRNCDTNTYLNKVKNEVVNSMELGISNFDHAKHSLLFHTVGAIDQPQVIIDKIQWLNRFGMSMDEFVHQLENITMDDVVSYIRNIYTSIERCNVVDL